MELDPGIGHHRIQLPLTRCEQGPTGRSWVRRGKRGGGGLGPQPKNSLWYQLAKETAARQTLKAHQDHSLEDPTDLFNY